uniref:Uncharacterized protein n=1 Tax=viral metagenome TaxID=1070528 RepID=A0A6H1ZBZ1_9ZZZZ
MNIKQLAIGLIAGIALMSVFQFFNTKNSPEMLGAVPSNGGLIGIYNASDLTLRDGYGSALATDQHGRLITTSTSP